MQKNNMILLTFVSMICALFAFGCVSADFFDDFSQEDYEARGWSGRLLFGKPDLEYLYPMPDRLSIHMPDYNTAIYLLNENTNTDDSTVEVTFENVFSRHGEVGIVCRYHEDGWYELRAVLSGQYAGSYALYRYDGSLRAKNKNPFVSLHPDQDRFYTMDINVGRNEQNTFKMVCEGEKIRIFINGNEQDPPWNKEFWAKEYKDGLNGFSVWTETPYGLAQIDAINFRSLFDDAE